MPHNVEWFENSPIKYHRPTNRPTVAIHAYRLRFRNLTNCRRNRDTGIGLNKKKPQIHSVITTLICRRPGKICFFNRFEFITIVTVIGNQIAESNRCGRTYDVFPNSYRFIVSRIVFIKFGVLGCSFQFRGFHDTKLSLLNGSQFYLLPAVACLRFLSI